MSSDSQSYQKGLKQLEKLMDEILKAPEGTVSETGLTFTPQLNSRSFKALNKDHLQVECEENDRQLKAKMVEDSVSGKWKCTYCSWKGKFKHKAKAHARSCGQRPKLHKKQTRDKKYTCSKNSCGMKFSSKTQLVNHYR